MSETRKRGRPSKNSSDDSSEKTAVKASDSINDVVKLQEMLAKAQRELDAMRIMNRYADKPMVTVKHSGHGPQLCITIEGENSVLLDPYGSASSATIPLTDYLNLKKNTNWVEKGYLFVEDDLDANNPNLILDVKDWFKSISEKKMLDQVSMITSEGVLHALYDFTEGIDKTSKVLALRNAVARKMEEIFDIDVSEDLSLERKSTGR